MGDRRVTPELKSTQIGDRGTQSGLYILLFKEYVNIVFFNYLIETNKYIFGFSLVPFFSSNAFNYIT